MRAHKGFNHQTAQWLGVLMAPWGGTLGRMPYPGAQLHTAGKHQGPQITELLKGCQCLQWAKARLPQVSSLLVEAWCHETQHCQAGLGGGLPFRRAHLALCCFLRSCLCLVVPAYLEEGGDHGNAPIPTVVLPQESCCLLPQMKLTGSQHLRLLAVTADV